MSFKLNLILVLSLTVLTSCIGKVGEEPPPQTAQEFSGSACLSKALPVVQEFLKGEANDRELGASWDCVSDAIVKFKRYVRGVSRDRYTSQELTTFLEDNFLSKEDPQEISPALQLEMMKIKQIFVGGSSEFLTQEELDKSLTVFASFKELSLQLNPYMKVFALNWLTTRNIQSDSRFFEEANETLQLVAKELSSLVAVNAISYRIEDAAVLFQEFETFYGEDWDITDELIRFMPVVKKVKKAIAAGDEEVVAPSEWRSFVLLGARGYIQYLRYYYFIKASSETNTGIKLSYISRSFEDGFSVFQDLVQEKSTGMVSRQEVDEIFMSFSEAWPDLKVSKILLDEIMNIKKLAIGGSVEAWSTSDFENAKLKVNRLKLILERFLPYYEVYGGEWDPKIFEVDAAETFFAEAQFALEASAQELGGLLESDYSLSSLSRLLAEIQVLYFSEDAKAETAEFFKLLQDIIPLVAEVKNATYAETDDLLRKDNWRSFLRFGSRAYNAYLYFEYFLKGQPYFDSRTDFAKFETFMRSSLQLINDILVNTPEANGFSKDQLLAMMGHLNKMQALPSQLTPVVLNPLLDSLLNHFLVPPEDRLAARASGRFDAKVIQQVGLEFKNWAEGLKFGHEFYNQKTTWSVAEIQKLLALVDPQTISSPQAAEALQELKIAFGSPVSLTVNKDSFLNISNKTEWPYDWASYKKINLHRLLSRLAINSYATDLSRIKSYQGFNLSEAEAAFAQLKPIFVELKLIDPANTSFISNRFREANIFTPRADGDNLVSFAELSDLVSIIWSGINVHSALIVEAESACLKPGQDTSGIAVKIQVPCLRKTYYSVMPILMTGTPAYADYIKQSPKGAWDIYFSNVIKAAGYIPNSGQLMSKGDISLVPQVIQYVEMIFARFDNNRDGFISTPDAMRAFPAFKGLMKELAAEQIKNGDISEADLDDVFTFILRYGRPPTSTGEKIRFALRWRNKPKNWDVWADRTQLAQILGFIADEIAKTATAKSASN